MSITGELRNFPAGSGFPPDAAGNGPGAISSHGGTDAETEEQLK
jgi:hypothetical protein